jgi:Carboxypeptidase regulatory-like domain
MSTLTSLLAVFLLALFPAPAPLGQVHGTVTDPTGAVVAKAAILFQHWEVYSGSPGRAIDEPLVYSDYEGKFDLSLGPGTYNVLVTYPGFSPFAAQIAIKSSSRESLSCKLSFSPVAKFVE